MSLFPSVSWNLLLLRLHGYNGLVQVVASERGACAWLADYRKGSGLGSGLQGPYYQLG